MNYDKALSGAILEDGSRMTRILSGYRFLEGPVWHPALGELFFSDIPGNAIYRWNPGHDASIFRPNSYLANGNTLDRQGRLLTCEHATSRVTRTTLDGSNCYEVLASHWQGKELNSPNDIIVRSDGGIFFTDPTPGRMARVGIPRPRQLSFQGVYRIDPETGVLSLLADDFSKPNGLCFDKNETRLFVNDTDRGHIRAFATEPCGSFTDLGVWVELPVLGPGVADGLKIDEEGRIFCCGPGGIQVFNPDASFLGLIEVPEIAANFTWGDDDRKTMYIAATSSIYRIRTCVPGIVPWPPGLASS
jgi:gluconolactonase